MSNKNIISFGTKEELNKKRREEFIKLTPNKRFEEFLKLCVEMAFFSGSNKTNKKSDNYIIEL